MHIDFHCDDADFADLAAVMRGLESSGLLVEGFSASEGCITFQLATGTHPTQPADAPPQSSAGGAFSEAIGMLSHASRARDTTNAAREAQAAVQDGVSSVAEIASDVRDGIVSAAGSLFNPGGTLDRWVEGFSETNHRSRHTNRQNQEDRFGRFTDRDNPRRGDGPGASDNSESTDSDPGDNSGL